MRILICGGRDFQDARLLGIVMNKWLNDPDLSICHGGARGADKLAGVWANHHDIPCTTYPADWAHFGRSAGYRRNEQMLRDFKPDLVVAFPGGVGTAHMLKIAIAAKVRTVNVRPGSTADVM